MVAVITLPSRAAEGSSLIAGGRDASLLDTFLPQVSVSSLRLVRDQPLARMKMRANYGKEPTRLI